MTNCTYNITIWWDTVLYPEPYEDIEGRGALAGFLGTAWLMIAMIVAHYLAFFDPELDPFGDASCSREPKTSFKPNPIDTMLLALIRRWSRSILSRLGCSSGEGRSPDLSRLQRSMMKCILNFVDLQLIAGLGILISGFLSLNQGLSAYHWLMLVYLAWLSNITHLSGLTALRGYFHSHQWERGWRLALMFIFLVLLLTALGPTAFFNWEGIGFPENPADFTVVFPITPARCSFFPGKSVKAFQEQLPELSTPFFRTPAFQSMMVSMAMLLLNFFSRLLRVFRCVSEFFIGKLRRRAHNLVKQTLCRLSTTRHSSPWTLNEKQRDLLMVKPCLAMFIAVRLYVDIFLSTVSEIFWLIISSLWATLHLLNMRLAAQGNRSYFGSDEEGITWTFGQILSVLMLLGPAITATGAFFGDSEHTVGSSDPQSPGGTDSISTPAGRDGTSSQASDAGSLQTAEWDLSGGQIRNDADSENILLEPGSRLSRARAITEFETDPGNQEQVWLQRNYYETNWASAICFWSCLQVYSIGVFIVIFGALGYRVFEFGRLSNITPLTLLRLLWVWVFIAQPVGTFALILINLAGEEFQGGRKWLSRSAVSHALTMAVFGIGAISFVLPISGFDMGLGYDYSQINLPSFILACATYALAFLLYGVWMFIKAR